jgi:dimethylargininase
MLIAVTREVSPAISRCELTHAARVPIDAGLARAQHRAYERALEDAGCTIVRVEAAPDLPDSVFVEDIAIVLDELAIIARPGAPSRRAETAGVGQVVGGYRRLHAIQAPGTLDGGDVLVIGRRIFVGHSSRTNQAAITQMTDLVAPYGYRVRPVRVTGCLHLKSAVTALADNRLLINRQWLEEQAFDDVELVDVDPLEPAAANVVRVGDELVYPASFPRTRARLEARGLRVRTVDVGEIAKAEGAVTCCSLIFRRNSGSEA